MILQYCSGGALAWLLHARILQAARLGMENTAMDPWGHSCRQLPFALCLVTRKDLFYFLFYFLFIFCCC